MNSFPQIVALQSLSGPFCRFPPPAAELNRFRSSRRPTREGETSLDPPSQRMAETEFIGPGGIVRQTILNNATSTAAAPTAAVQWKQDPQVVVTAAANNFYPYEWKVEEATLQPPKAKMQVKQVAVDLKPQQTIICSNAAWTTSDYIKWENNPITVTVTKPLTASTTTTLNTTGLQFISQQPQNNRPTKNGTIIETFKCEVCNQIFSSMNSLQSHVAQVHERKKFSTAPLHCEYKYSGLTIENSQQLPTIIATGTAAAAGGSTNFANATFAAPSNLTITNVTNQQTAGIIVTKNGKIRKEKKRNWECGVCRNRFSRKDHLAKHVSAVHEKIRPFECGHCGQKFSQKHHLRAHMLARHEDDKLAAKAFACGQCPKRFTRNDHLERHIESVHEKRKQFECAVCAHQFARKHHLSKHILAVHAKVKPYGCNQCDQSFLQRHHLGAHIMSVHQPPIQEEPDGTKSYVCAICSHRFKRKDHLKKHVETVHEKTRAFQCMLCERRFGQKYHLAIHVSAVHEGKKPYACTMCSHKSARKSGLQRHMRTVHNVKNPQIASQPMQQQQILTVSASAEPNPTEQVAYVDVNDVNTT